VRLGQAALDLAAEHLDTVDPTQLLVGRAALEASRAAQEYLTLSDATAASVRSQRMVLPSGDCGGGRLEAAAAVWRRLDQALRGEPLSDVAAAEWCAFTAISSGLVSRGTVSRPPRGRFSSAWSPSITGLADSLCGLVRGDLGAHLAALPRAGTFSASSRPRPGGSTASLAWARSPSRAPDRQAREWLAAEGDDGHAPTHAAAQVHRAQACRSALGRRRRAIPVARPSVSAGRAAGAAVAAPAARLLRRGSGCPVAKWKSSAMRSTDFRWPPSSASQVRVEMRPYMTSRVPCARTGPGSCALAKTTTSR